MPAELFDISMHQPVQQVINITNINNISDCFHLADHWLYLWSYIEKFIEISPMYICQGGVW